VNFGSFVWSDGSVGAVPSFGDNTFTARAAGGARFYTIADLSVGVNLPAGGGAWAPISDRAVKDNVRPVDARDVLEKVAALPLNTWNYKSQDASIRHIGPMAQDFHAAFGVGEDERHITTVDADGVALAAIQGLNKRLEQELRARDAEIGELRSAVSEMKQLIQRLAAQRREEQREPGINERQRFERETCPRPLHKIRDLKQALLSAGKGWLANAGQHKPSAGGTGTTPGDYSVVHRKL
jgi:hypothetical protein